MKCSDCKWFRLRKENVGGFCHLYPPEVLPSPPHMAVEYETITRWPFVFVTDFCSQFEEGESPDEKARS